MKRIKLFEEASNLNEVWVVNIVYYDGDMESTRVFSTKEKAADFYIKEINREFNKNFEPMVDESGIRNFHTADENPDFLRAINYMEGIFYERHGRNITRLFYINGFKVE
jgi:hypothetical protein